MIKTAHAHPAEPAAGAFAEVPLAVHPAGVPGPVRSLVVSGTLRPSGVLELEYRLAASLERVRLVPSACHAQRRDELWRHTCFELFAARDDDEAYCEFNFTPGGDWAAYTFATYREARRDAPQRRIEVSLRASADGLLRLQARLDLAAAFELDAAAAAAAHWWLNCAAVVEDIDGAIGCWALHHPRAQPDFHDRAGFRIRLAGPAPAVAAERQR